MSAIRLSSEMPPTLAASGWMMSNGSRIYAGLQVILSCDNAPLIEFDAYGGLGWEGFLADPPVVKDGRVWATEEPGIGVRITDGAEERFSVQIGV